MRLSFNLPEPRSMERLRAIFEKLASTLTGRPVSLQRLEHSVLEDLNGANACFTARWSDGPITWRERVTCGSGNPRDGYGYDLEFALVLPAHELTLRSGGWDPVPSSMVIELNSNAREWLTLRELLRRELGPESDQSHVPWTTFDTVAVLSREGEQAAALELARECIQRAKSTDPFREEVISWLAAHDPSAGGAAMRVKEAPAMLEAWLELERQGDGSLSETFARLCPFELTRWRAAGHAPGPWFAHPRWPLERAQAEQSVWRTIHLTATHVEPGFSLQLGKELTGWEWGTDWRDLSAEWLPGLSGWRWQVSRRARYPEGAKVPVVHVQLSGVRRAPEEWELPFEQQCPRPYKETLRWSWLAGMNTGDVVVLAERGLPIPRRGASPSAAAIAYTAIGSAEFRSRAEAAVTRLTHLKWHPVELTQSLEPWKQPEPPFTDLPGALEAALPADDLARVRVLMQCKCAARFCGHRVELSQTSHKHRFSHLPAQRARGGAWAAAAAMTSAPPDPEAAKERLREVHENLLHAAEYVE